MAKKSTCSMSTFMLQYLRLNICYFELTLVAACLTVAIHLVEKTF